MLIEPWPLSAAYFIENKEVARVDRVIMFGDLVYVSVVYMDGRQALQQIGDVAYVDLHVSAENARAAISSAVAA